MLTDFDRMRDMLIWIVTAVLVLMAASGWLFLRRDADRYIHEETSLMNIFFKWGRAWHHVFKVAIIVLVMIVVFSLYRYLLSASQVFALTSAVAAGVILTGGKELLDKKITLDDVVSSTAAIIFGFFLLFLFF